MIHAYEQNDGISCVTENQAETAVNVVFVHGLGGGAYSTWNSGDSSDLGYWPASFANDHPRCCVWSVHYTARILEWNPLARSSTIDILDRAAWLAELMVLKQIPTKPIVFVAHSLGGILVKQTLQFSQYLGPPQWRTIWEQTQAVLFLATPHVGSGLAGIAISVANALRGSSLLTRPFLRPSLALRNLKKDNPVLRYLGDWYRDRAPAQGIQTIAFAEGRSTIGRMVVSESSANPQIADVRAILLPEDDHISIAKPTDKKHPVYESLNKCLEVVEKRAASGTASWTPAQTPVDHVTIARAAENRRLIRRLAGAWWEHISTDDANKNKISFIRIVPDMLFNSVRLSGSSYNRDGVKVADWRSVSARIEKDGNQILVYYLWKGRHTAPEIASIQFHGFGTLEFNVPADPDDVITCGGGRFWDVNEAHPEKTVLKPIDLRRILRQEPVGTMTKGTPSEIRELIKSTLNEWQDS